MHCRKLLRGWNSDTNAVCIEKLLSCRLIGVVYLSCGFILPISRCQIVVLYTWRLLQGRFNRGGAVSCSAILPRRFHHLCVYFWNLLPCWFYCSYNMPGWKRVSDDLCISGMQLW